MAEHMRHLNGGVLRWARQRREMSREYAAARLSIKNGDKIKQWEEQKAGPTYRQLEEIADLYGVPVAVFFFPSPPDVEDPKKSLRRLLAEDAGVLSPGVLKAVHHAQAAQMALMEMNEGVNPISDPLHKVFRLSERAGGAADAAAVLRGPAHFNVSTETQLRWGGRHAALAEWRLMIEDRGIFVFQMPFADRKDAPSECSGFCLYDEEFPVICLNSKEFAGRRSFTLMHELAHLLRGDNALTLLSGEADESAVARFRDSDAERFCDQFAGNMLIPDEDFKRQALVKNTGGEFFRALSRRYWVSESMAAMKCVKTGIISPAAYRKFMDERPNFPGRQKSGGGDYYSNQIARWGKGFLANAFACLHQNRVDRFDLCETLRVKLANLDKLEDAFFKASAKSESW